MPKKKKKKPQKRSSKRGRVSGGKGDLGAIAGVVVGVVGARLMNQFAVKQWPTTDKKLIGALPAAVGAFFVLNPMKMSVLNSSVAKGVSYGLIAGGVANFGTEMGWLKGGQETVMLKRRVAGPNDVPVVGGARGAYIDRGNPNYVPNVGGGTMGKYRRRMAGAM
jgi:uncharacterized membrane protein YeaQ/YmgE (transglycosylase-associated protein family)